MYIKAMNKDMTCRGLNYEVGKSYQIEGELKMCKNGFHFCDSLDATLSYYSVNSRYFQVAYFGKIIFEDDKYASSGIRIIRELEEQELIELAGGEWMCEFACDVVNADVEAIEKRLLELENSCWLYYFSRYVVGADIQAIEKRLLELGDSYWLCEFAEDIEGANIEAIEKRLIEIGREDLAEKLNN